LAGLEKEQSGAVLLDGRALRKKQRRRTFGMVMQNVDHQLFSDTVTGECRLGNGTVSDEQITEILDLLQLSDYREQHPQSLSGGQRQRVTIAAVLPSGKQILLLDEPTSGLDYGNMMTVSRALRAHAANGGLCIVVTHDTELIRALYA
ncbi:MAG: ATP-binding cassette domain-containing protein, partial [Oscillospiraceae bacterium]|nr:ATP-binding cassette domain-containing protein [Oscillospiraceae bacterium]